MRFSPRHRQIVTLVGRDGRTYHEVASELGISKHTVVQHIRVITRRSGLAGRPRSVLNRLYWTELHRT